MFFYFLGSKVCYDEATHLTKKVREALKKNDETFAADNSTSSSSSSNEGNSNQTTTTTDSTAAEQQNSNTKDADSESVKKRDKV